MHRLLLGLLALICFSCGENSKLTLQVELPPSYSDTEASRLREECAAALCNRAENLGLADFEVTTEAPDLLKIHGSFALTQDLQDSLLTRTTLRLAAVHPEYHTLAERKSVSGYKLYPFTSEYDGERFSEELWLSNRYNITEEHIEEVSADLTREGYLNVSLNAEGAALLRRVTSRMTLGRERIAVLVNDRVIVAPTVQAVLSKDFQISGLDAPGEARRIANTLGSPLPAKVTIVTP